MSRIGRWPIPVPSGVQVSVKGTNVHVEGPKGQLDVDISPRIRVEADEDGTLTFHRPSDHRDDRAQHGLARSLVANAIKGVNEGFVKRLEIQGVGYRCQMKGAALELAVGYSHPARIEPPEGVSIDAPQPTRIEIRGIDKQAVGQVAADIRAVRPPDAYHGKGVRYEGERVRLKAGKAASR
ncbi:MAG: 50S ribosomal protein L6 [Trueperaceae bacterium]|nr:50S ribosomal protein L6 [Trueperaceae bacterium]